MTAMTNIEIWIIFEQKVQGLENSIETRTSLSNSWSLGRRFKIVHLDESMWSELGLRVLV